MYIFNKITVNPQLPKRIGKLSEIANNLWWSWNTEFLRLFKMIDRDLWETCEKNPVKFLKQVSQDRLEAVATNQEFLKEYDRLAKEFDDYVTSKNTWFSNKYPENKKDLIAYFSAEYGLDQTIPIYSGGLGILSGDHLKSASDLGIPLVAVGLLYKNGYFHQKINGYGDQETEYNNIDLSNLPENTVLVGKDLSTSDTAKLNLKTIAGIIIENGSENSHVSIMARTHEIPAIVGVKGALDSIPNDSDIAINGETGEIFINPSPEEISKLTKIKNELKDEKGNLAKFKNKKSITKDGYKTEVVANIGTPKDMDATIENGAEGVGLFRSEFLYMDSESMPTEEEQFEAYKEVLEKAEGKRVIVRTLDIGGDKDLKYLNLDKEDNPFLGYRAIRICLREPEIFKVQLRALYRASNYGKLAIMLPMISSVDEIRSAKDIINEVKEELKAENIKFDKNVKVGIMIEVPSAAIMAEQLATECDFFSIGTNDLIQYTVAVERGNEKISDLYTKFHPAVIRLIKMAIDGAHKSKIFCGMCGEAAADERFIPLLVGLGLDEFSMNPTKILNSRKMIRNLNHKECKKLVQEILRMSSASEIKARLEEYKDNL